MLFGKKPKLGFDPTKPILEQFPQTRHTNMARGRSHEKGRGLDGKPLGHGHKEVGQDYDLPVHLHEINAYIFSVGAPKALIEALLPDTMRESSWFSAVANKDPLLQFMFADVVQSSVGPVQACYLTIPCKPKAGGDWGGYMLWVCGGPVVTSVFGDVWGMEAQPGTVTIAKKGPQITTQVQAEDGTLIRAAGLERGGFHIKDRVPWHFYVPAGDKTRGCDNWLQIQGASSTFLQAKDLSVEGPLLERIGAVLEAQTYLNLQVYHKCVGVHCAHSREV